MKGLLGKIREGWTRYLEKLARANQKNFGTGPLDCCSLKKDESDKSKRINQTRR